MLFIFQAHIRGARPSIDEFGGLCGRSRARRAGARHPQKQPAAAGRQSFMQKQTLRLAASPRL